MSVLQLFQFSALTTADLVTLLQDFDQLLSPALAAGSACRMLGTESGCLLNAMQVTALQDIPSTDGAIIYTLIPVMGGAFAW